MSIVQTLRTSLEKGEVINVPENQNGPVFPTCALPFLRSNLDRDGVRCVVDFGPAYGTNVQSYSDFSQKIYIEDFYTSWQDDYKGEPLNEAMIESILPRRSGAPFGLLLCWDTFDYLSDAEAKLLAQYLNRNSSRGTTLMCMLSTGTDIPKVPTGFRIVDDKQIQYQVRSKERKPSPRHPVRWAQELLAPFVLVKSFLLRHGMQELIFQKQ